MSTLSFFDCNLLLGRRSAREVYSPWKTEDILETLKRCGITNAMTLHAASLEYHPVTGNQMICQICQAHTSLYPVWSVLPGATGDFPSGHELAKQLQKNGVRMVKAFPNSARQNFSLSNWGAADLLEVLESCHLPLLLDSGDLQWSEINTLANEHPKLPLLLTNLNYRMDRMLYPLLELHENIYLETSGLKGFSGIEAFCGRFGAGRLLFGTGMPIHSAGAAVSLVELSDISHKEKRMIARENLIELLSQVAW